MNSSDPIWYEALQGNPLQKQTFTEELKVRIKTKVQSASTQRSNRKPQFAIVSLALICVFGFMIFVTQSSEELSVNGNSEQLSQPYYDNEWQGLINERYPESNNVVMFTHKDQEGKTVVFYRKMYESKGFRSISIGIDVFEWKSDQWSYDQGVAYSMGDPMREGYKENLLTANFQLAEMPQIIGAVMDPQITQIQVVDDQNRNYPVDIISNVDGYRYWYIAIPEEVDGHLKLEGLDVANRVLASKAYYFR